MSSRGGPEGRDEHAAAHTAPPDDLTHYMEATSRLRVELVRKDEQVRRLVLALTNIADTDYRGNRSTESVQAQRVLVEEGFRAE